MLLVDDAIAALQTLARRVYEAWGRPVIGITGSAGKTTAKELIAQVLSGAGVILMMFSIIASSRYIWWRVTQTMDLAPGLESFLGGGLLAAECYTWTILVLGYIQNARPLRRKPATLPLGREGWPTVA